MKILITGSEGFIGTHLKERLQKEGHEIIGLDNMAHACKFKSSLNEFIKDDVLNIRDYEDRIKDCDFIVHLAAQIHVEKSIEDPRDTANTNFLGTLEVLEIGRKHNIPVIFASSTEIYGDRLTETMDESHVMNPKSPYAACKMGADGLCKAYYHTYGSKVVIVRNFNTFGKYQSNDKFGAVISIFADRINKGLPPQIYGGGNQRRDFMGYKDAIDFYMLILEKAYELKLWGQEFNVGMGKSISINEVADKIIKLSGKTQLSPIHIKPRPGEVKDFVCNNTKAKSIGWNPDTDFDKLLKEYLEWKNKDR